MRKKLEKLLSIIGYLGVFLSVLGNAVETILDTLGLGEVDSEQEEKESSPSNSKKEIVIAETVKVKKKVADAKVLEQTTPIEH